MKATVTRINPRIKLQLDVAFVFEALILIRLRRLPKGRREEWLRGLLVQGFQRECGQIRKAQRTDQMGRDAALSQGAATRPDVSAAEHRSAMSQTKADPETSSGALHVPHSNDTVSFAELRKVIG